MKKRSGIVHAYAICFDCGWSLQGKGNVLGTAARHARASGHKVNCEQGLSVTYNPDRIPREATEDNGDE